MPYYKHTVFWNSILKFAVLIGKRFGMNFHILWNHWGSGLSWELHIDSVYIPWNTTECELVKLFPFAVCGWCLTDSLFNMLCDFIPLCKNRGAHFKLQGSSDPGYKEVLIKGVTCWQDQGGKPMLREAPCPTNHRSTWRREEWSLDSSLQ